MLQTSFLTQAPLSGGAFLNCLQSLCRDSGCLLCPPLWRVDSRATLWEKPLVGTASCDSFTCDTISGPHLQATARRPGASLSDWVSETSTCRRSILLRVVRSVCDQARLFASSNRPLLPNAAFACVTTTYPAGATCQSHPEYRYFQVQQFFFSPQRVWRIHDCISPGAFRRPTV